MILLIDTSHIEHFFIGLANESVLIYQKQIIAHFEQEEKLLTRLDEMCKKMNCQPSSFTGIIVVNGPGSFSALRIGLAIANTLAWQLNIPVEGVHKSFFQTPEELLQVGYSALQNKSGFTLILPAYDKEPNINIKK